MKPQHDFEEERLVRLLGKLSAISTQAETLVSQMDELRREIRTLETQIDGVQPVFSTHYTIRPTSILVPIVAEGAKLPVYCVHPIEGGVVIYRELAKLLGRDRPFVAVQPVGIVGNERPLDSVAAMAERYRREIEQQQPAGPYNIMAWSMGGLIAFEMAQRWRASSEQVSLCLIDTAHPDFWREHFRTGKGVRDFIAGATEIFEFDDVQWANERNVEEVFAAIDRHGRLKPGRQHLKRSWEVLKANNRAGITYQTSSYSDRAVFIQASEPTFGRPEEYAQPWHDDIQSLVRYVAPGDHRSILQGSNVAVVAEQIEPFLLNTPEES